MKFNITNKSTIEVVNKDKFEEAIAYRITVFNCSRAKAIRDILWNFVEYDTDSTEGGLVYCNSSFEGFKTKMVEE